MAKQGLWSTFPMASFVALCLVACTGEPPAEQGGPTNRSAPLRAFPTAEGFGTETAGGRGGRVIYVTKLIDTPEPGTLRNALEATGPRLVLFNVAGTIRLEDDVSITQPFITIAGQTAPGEGVQIRGGMIKVKTHDVVMRYLKLRPGDEINESPPVNRDAVSLTAIDGHEVYNVVLDHCSMVWGPDIGGLSILTNAHHITIQYSIMGEGLYHSTHPEALPPNSHSKGANVTQLGPKYGGEWPRFITFHHNLFTSSDDRMPQIRGAEFVDVVNNVIYNWGWHPARGNPRSLNLVRNMFIRGVETKKLVAWEPSESDVLPQLFPDSVYEQGTLTEGFDTVRGAPSWVYSETRFSPYSMRSENTPQKAYNLIVQDVGANRPIRDTVDERIIRNLEQRVGRFLSGTDLVWPILSPGAVPTDIDEDGMPDDWEFLHFGTISRGRRDDSGSDFDGDGYTDVEEYLNMTDPKLPENIDDL